MNVTSPVFEQILVPATIWFRNIGSNFIMVSITTDLPYILDIYIKIEYMYIELVYKTIDIFILDNFNLQ